MYTYVPPLYQVRIRVYNHISLRVDYEPGGFYAAVLSEQEPVNKFHAYMIHVIKSCTCIHTYTYITIHLCTYVCTMGRMLTQ